MKVEIKSLSHGEYAENEGGFYAVVDGKNIGEAERAFWPTRNLARLCAKRYVIAQTMIRELKAHAQQVSK